MNAQHDRPLSGREMRGLRARVVDRLKGGAQSEMELAAALDMARDDVAEACGFLLVAGRVVLREDKTYVLKAVSR